jgi:hypothetical protein
MGGNFSMLNSWLYSMFKTQKKKNPSFSYFGDPFETKQYKISTV